MSINPIAALIASMFLAEGDDQGCDSLNMIFSLGSAVQATDFDSEEGVCTLTVKGPEAAAQLIQALDDEECVGGYDVTYGGGSDEDPEVEDILTLPEDTVFGFIIYLDDDYITYDGEDDDLEESTVFGQGEAAPFTFDAFGRAQTLEEVKRKVKMNFKGKKRIKMQCNPGFRYDPSTKACVKIGGAEIAKKRKANIRALVTRKAGGAALKKRAKLRTKKAMKFRAAMGLK